MSIAQRGFCSADVINVKLKWKIGRRSFSFSLCNVTKLRAKNKASSSHFSFHDQLKHFYTTKQNRLSFHFEASQLCELVYRGKRWGENLLLDLNLTNIVTWLRVGSHASRRTLRMFSDLFFIVKGKSSESSLITSRTIFWGCAIRRKLQNSRVRTKYRYCNYKKQENKNFLFHSLFKLFMCHQLAQQHEKKQKEKTSVSFDTVPLNRIVHDWIK